MLPPFLVPLQANQRASGFCEQGAIAVVTSGATSTTKVQASYPLCTVTIYLSGTTTPAIIYSDNSSTPLSNPFTASASGFWFFYAANGRYDAKLSGGSPALPAPWTIGDILLYDAGALGPVVNSFNGRSGTVAPLTGDYTAAMVTNAASLISSNSWSGTNTFTAVTTFSAGVNFNGAATFNGANSYTGNNTWTGSISDARGQLHTLPFKTGVVASRPATCTTGEVYFASDVTAGVNLYYCTSTNVWTQQASGGGGGGGSTTFDLIGSGTNTGATMTVGSGATLATSGSGTVNFAAAGHTTAMRIGTAAAITGASCVQGETAFATDATAGQNIYFCTSTNTWTQQLNSGGGGGSAFNAISGGTNTSAAMIVGSGASLTVAGTGTINATAFNGGTAPVSGSVWKSNSSLQPVASLAADIVGLFSTCSGTQYLGADGSCHTAGGGSSLPFADNVALLENSSDTTKQARFSLASLTTGTTRVLTLQDASYTLAGVDISNTFSAANVFNSRATFTNTANPAAASSILATISSTSQAAIAVNNTGGAGTSYGIVDTSTAGSAFTGPVQIAGGKFTVNNLGAVTEYASEITNGHGLPDVVFASSATGQTVTQAFNLQVNSGIAPAGTYLVAFTLRCTLTSASAAADAQVMLNSGNFGALAAWPSTNQQGSAYASSPNLSCGTPASNSSGAYWPAVALHADGTHNMVLTITVSGAGFSGGTAQYGYDVMVMRLN